MDLISRYDMLEVLLDHAPATDPALTLACLQDVLEPRFEIEPLEHVRARSPDARRRQVVRIAAVQGEAFASAAAFDDELRELVGDGYAWARIGAIRAGLATTVRG